MPIAEIQLNPGLKGKLRKLARIRRIPVSAAARIAFEQGIEIAEAMIEESSGERTDDERSVQLANLANDIEVCKKELNAISVRAASEHFFSSEEYQKVSSLLRLYLVRRSEAINLNENLKKAGLHYDLSKAEIQDLEDLERRYLFKKERQS
ncbi:MAG: hypothetical protein QW505_05005 [Thermoplasmata archaeon]